MIVTTPSGAMRMKALIVAASPAATFGRFRHRDVPQRGKNRLQQQSPSGRGARHEE